MSVGGYVKRAKDKAEAWALTSTFVLDYHLHAKLLDALRTRVEKPWRNFRKRIAMTCGLSLLHTACQRKFWR